MSERSLDEAVEALVSRLVGSQAKANPTLIALRGICKESARQAVILGLRRAAMIHESVNVACDHERPDVPGAGAMAAVIQFRDLIRAEADRLDKGEA